MADEIKADVILNIESRIPEVTQELIALDQAYIKNLTTLKTLEAQQKKGTAEWLAAKSAVKNTGDEYRQTSRQLDNLNKAFTSTTGSQQQLRAATAALTPEWNKMSQAEREASQEGIKLKKTLTDLKDATREVDKSVGNTSSSVGNYSNEIQQALSKLSGSIPGLSQYSGVIQSVTKVAGFLPMAMAKAGQGFKNLTGNVSQSFMGFKQFQGSTAAVTEEVEAAAPAVEEAGTALASTGEAAAGAGEGMAGLAASAGPVGLAVSLVVGALAAVWGYMKDVAGVSDTLTNKWAGLKAQSVAVINTIREQGLFSGNLAKATRDAQNAAEGLSQAMIDLGRASVVSDVQTNRENNWISEQMLRLRNLHTTAAQAEAIFKHIQEVSEQQYKRVKANADEGFHTTAKQIALGAGLAESQMEFIMRRGVAAAEWYKKQGKHISDDMIQQLQKFENERINAEGIKTQTEERAQNRSEQREAKDQAKADSAKEKAERDREKAKEDLAEAKRFIDESHNERMAANAKTLQDAMESFGKELALNNEMQRIKLFKEAELQTKLAGLRDKTKSKSAKAEFQTAINTAEENKKAIRAEHDAQETVIIEKHNKELAQQAQKAQDELDKITIAGIKNNEQRQIASLKEDEDIRKREYNQEFADRATERDKALQESYTATGKSKQELLKKVQALKGIQAIADKESEQKAKETADAINKIIQKSDEDLLEWNDKQAQLRAKPGSAEDYAAQKQTLTDETDKSIQASVDKGPDSGGLLQDTSGTRAEYQRGITNIDEKAQLDRKTFEIDVAKQTADAGFSIIQNSIKQEEQARIASLERQKTLELRNSALTVTQKQVIDDKYRKKEYQAQVKAFKSQQQFSALEAVINGALAITKATSQTGIGSAFVIPLIIAETIAEVAKIESQKPPAFAQGGTFRSDGRGALLPGYSKKDNLNSTLRSGEAVIVSEAARDPYARSVLSAINQAFGGRPLESNGKKAFASGGIYNSNAFLPSVDSGLRITMPGLNSGSSRMHPDDLSALINGFSDAAASLPPPITDVKDVNSEQGKISRIDNRTTY